MPRDKRQMLDAIADMRSKAWGLREIAEALGLTKGYVGWLCYEYDIPKARKKYLVGDLHQTGSSCVNECGAVRPKET